MVGFKAEMLKSTRGRRGWDSDLKLIAFACSEDEVLVKCVFGKDRERERPTAVENGGLVCDVFVRMFNFLILSHFSLNRPQRCDLNMQESDSSSEESLAPKEVYRYYIPSRRGGSSFNPFETELLPFEVFPTLRSNTLSPALKAKLRELLEGLQERLVQKQLCIENAISYHSPETDSSLPQFGSLVRKLQGFFVTQGLIKWEFEKNGLKPLASWMHSILITTAFSPDRKIADVYSEGAGFINFPEALDPGLVNACDDKEFVNFLVGQGYKKKSLRKIFEWNGDKTKAIKASELNYPSLAEYCSTKGNLILKPSSLLSCHHSIQISF
ncbi:subtilisin-like protease SBT3.5 isoform X2 [Fagus crenata]